jgi:hypothetical protein
MQTNTIIIIVVVVLLVLGLLAVGGYYWYEKDHPSASESYTHAGEFDLSLVDQYQHINSPESHVPTPYFADLVDGGDTSNAGQVEQANTLKFIRPLNRLDRDAESLMMPRTSKNVTPYNIDVADPKTHMFQVNMPRVQLKDPQWQQADPYRGDIPIKFAPNVPLINKSRYGTRSSWRGDGFFSDTYKDLYAKYTGQAYLNKPIMVANEGTIMDYVPQNYIN